MKSIKIFFIGLLILLLLGCSGGDNSESSSSNSTTETSSSSSTTETSSSSSSTETSSSSSSTETSSNIISGYAQKGPFEAGASITVFELDDDLQQTGTFYRTNTLDDKGNYSLPANITSNYIEIFVEGYYYDEVSGKKSSSPYELSVIASTSDNNVNINVLTSLAKDRVRELVSNNISFSDAKTQSNTEVLKVFNLDDQNVSLEDMDLTESSDSGSALLAASSILMQAAYDEDSSALSAELTTLMANIKYDLVNNNGEVTTLSIKNKIKNASKNMDISSIKNNLSNRFSIELVDDFGQYVDQDGDGFLDKEDDDIPEDFKFVKQVVENSNEYYISNTINISGLKENGFTIIKVDDENATIIKNGIELSNKSSSVKNGDTLALKLKSGIFGSIKKVILTVGILEKEFVLETKKPSVSYLMGTVDWSGADTDNNKYQYYAIPFETTNSIDLKYLYVGINSIYNTSSVESISIYNDNSDVPGTQLYTTNIIENYFNDSFLYTIFSTDSLKVKKDPFDSSKNLYIKPYSSNSAIFLGNKKLLANEKYWVVVKFPLSVDLVYQVHGEANVGPKVPFSERKASNDGINWSQWGGFDWSTPINSKNIVNMFFAK